MQQCGKIASYRSWFWSTLAIYIINCNTTGQHFIVCTRNTIIRSLQDSGSLGFLSVEGNKIPSYRLGAGGARRVLASPCAK